MKTLEKKRPGPVQTLISLAVLGVLIIVGIGVYYSHFNYNPSVLALRPSTINASRKDILPLIAGLISIVPASPVAVFNPATLFEKINGRADLYLSAGFQELKTQRFEVANQHQTWMEIFVYHMGNTENSFSVFSLQKRADVHPLSITSNAYMTENSVFFTHGKYYVEIIGSDGSEATRSAIRSMAERFVQINVAEKPPDKTDTNRFPETGLIKGSIKMISTNAFGYEKMDRVYTADYLVDGKLLTAFLSDRKHQGDAEDLTKDYIKFLTLFGGNPIIDDQLDTSLKVLEIMDTYEVVFSMGGFIAGVHEAEDIDAAKSLAGQLFLHLKELDK